MIVNMAFENDRSDIEVLGLARALLNHAIFLSQVNRVLKSL